MKYSKRLEVFEKVRARYTGFLVSTLWKMTGDREIFAEAMQYALLAMWQRIQKLDSEKAASYIYRIALTANSKEGRNRIGKDGQASDDCVEVKTSPDSDVKNAEQAAIVGKAIAKLPPQQGRAIVMRYLEQKDYKTIAEAFGCSEAGVRSHVSKALATLKTRLSDLI